MSVLIIFNIYLYDCAYSWLANNFTLTTSPNYFPTSPLNVTWKRYRREICKRQVVTLRIIDIIYSKKFYLFMLFPLVTT